MTTPNARDFMFMHFRPAGYETNYVLPRGATVAIYRNSLDSKEVVLGVAQCSPRDIFCKKIGREVAAGRVRAYLETNTTTTFGINGMDEPHVRTLKVDGVQIDPDNIRESVAEYLYEYMSELGLK